MRRFQFLLSLAAALTMTQTHAETCQKLAKKFNRTQALLMKEIGANAKSDQIRTNEIVTTCAALEDKKCSGFQTFDGADLAEFCQGLNARVALNAAGQNQENLEMVGTSRVRLNVENKLSMSGD